MNDNEFRNIIKREFDNVKAAPSAQERILRELKGADTMEARANDIITSTNTAEVKKNRSWTTAVIAAAAAAAIGIGTFAVAKNKSPKKDDTKAAPGAAVSSEAEESTSEAQSQAEQQGSSADNSPLGLKPVEGAAGLWIVNDDTYLSPFIFDKNDGRIISADGKLEAKAIEGLFNTDWQGEAADGQKIVGITFRNLSSEALSGDFFAGVNVTAELQETYPLQLGYMMNSDVIEQGMEYTIDAGTSLTVQLAVPEDIGLSELTPRATVSTADGKTVAYAMLNENIDVEPVEQPSDESEPAIMTTPSEEPASEAEAPEESTDENEIYDEAIIVNEKQVIVPLSRDGDTFKSIDGRFEAEYVIIEGKPCVKWTNATGTTQKGDFFAGCGIETYIADGGNGPEVQYMYNGTENGMTAQLKEFDNIVVEIPLTDAADIDSVGEKVTPRAVIEGSDGKEYIYAEVSAAMNDN